MSDKIKSCPFCGSSDVKVDSELCVCQNCGSRAVRVVWNNRQGYTYQRENEMRKAERLALINTVIVLYKSSVKDDYEQENIKKIKESCISKVDEIMQCDDIDLYKNVIRASRISEDFISAVLGKQLTIHGEKHENRS